MTGENDTVQGLAFTDHVCQGDYKLCTDCIHFSVYGHPSTKLTDPSLGICRAFLSLVDGSQMYIKCSDARSSGALCGKDGSLWQPKTK